MQVAAVGEYPYPTSEQKCALCGKHTSLTLEELYRCLAIHPHDLTHILLSRGVLRSETGVKVAQYAAASPTLEWVCMYDNQMGNKAYREMATTLRFNTTLKYIRMDDNLAVDPSVEASFTEALRLNSDRPVGSEWHLRVYKFYTNDFEILKSRADALGSPSMLLFLDCADDCPAPMKTRTI